MSPVLEGLRTTLIDVRESNLPAILQVSRSLYELEYIPAVLSHLSSRQ
jgi:hypothetical protein